MPVALCTHTLPNGCPCRQAALRGKLLCRHHSRSTGIRRHPLHQQQLDRLRAEAANQSLHNLLLHLGRHLNRIQSAVREYPEARTFLSIVLERLAQEELEQLEQEDFAQFNTNSSDDLTNSSEYQDFLELLRNQSQTEQSNHTAQRNQ